MYLPIALLKIFLMLLFQVSIFDLCQRLCVFFLYASLLLGMLHPIINHDQIVMSSIPKVFIVILNINVSLRISQSSLIPQSVVVFGWENICIHFTLESVILELLLIYIWLSNDVFVEINFFLKMFFIHTLCLMFNLFNI